MKPRELGEARRWLPDPAGKAGTGSIAATREEKDTLIVCVGPRSRFVAGARISAPSASALLSAETEHASVRLLASQLLTIRS